MWNRKSIGTVALVIFVIFGITVVVYPLIYNPNKPVDATTPIDQPVVLPVK